MKAVSFPVTCCVCTALLMGIIGLRPTKKSVTLPSPCTVLVTCVDPRYMHEEHLDELPRAFRFSLVGSSKAFVDDEATRSSFYHQLEQLLAAGIEIDTIEWVDHLSCKGYGNKDSPEEHATYLREAARLLALDERSRDFKVELWLHDMNAQHLISIPLR